MVRVRRHAASILTVAAVAAAIGSSRADAAPVSEACNAWDVEYSLAANLRLAETPLGQGDGVYAIGPGAVVLRFDNQDGAPRGRVKMLSYTMQEHFTVVAKTLFWKTTVITDTRTAATPDRCWSAAEGALGDGAVRWSSPVRGYRTDGVLTCEGSLCGKFGAPPEGTSELHIAPHPVQFSPFVLGKDLKTLTMAQTLVSKTEVPKQTGYVAIAGREVRRSCRAVPPCP